MKRRQWLGAALVVLAAGCAGTGGSPVDAEFDVKGMVCESCVQAITHEVAKLPGVLECEVDLERETARVRFDPGQIELARIEATIEGLGYEATRRAG